MGCRRRDGVGCCRGRAAAFSLAPTPRRSIDLVSARRIGRLPSFCPPSPPLPPPPWCLLECDVVFCLSALSLGGRNLSLLLSLSLREFLTRSPSVPARPGRASHPPPFSLLLWSHVRRCRLVSFHSSFDSSHPGFSTPAWGASAPLLWGPGGSSWARSCRGARSTRLPWPRPSPRRPCCRPSPPAGETAAAAGLFCV